MNSGTNRFPINYFANMFKPKQIFVQRNAFNWWKLAFLFVFISACLMMPLTLQLYTIKTIPVSILAPSMSKMMNQDFTAQLQHCSIADGILHGTSYQQENGRNLLAIDPGNKWRVSGSTYHRSIRHFDNALVFQKKQLIISDQNGFGFTVLYPKETNFLFDGGKINMGNQIGQLWVRQYKADFFGAISLLSFAGLLISSMLLMGTMTFILWLTKRSKMSDIHSFRESASIIMMSAGLPSIAALIVSLIAFNFGTMMMIQSFGLVLMIAFVFWKTRFQDERDVRNKKMALAGSRR
ncbi:DUF1189 domain-containing protein [Sporolactobacillus pectinivorans]|uniref:DUF1189 domain-containing protein n=1 Tax=Sporolactobacillus pectinivorans TaxID=1591408 RepID=UPI000C268C4C|nr:maltodextrose utilization protein MalA [Sporolactobacillus pectinivorans]